MSSRTEKRPGVGPLLVAPDPVLLVVGERTPGAAGERLDVELELLGEQAVHRAAELEELVDGPFTLFEGATYGCGSSISSGSMWQVDVVEGRLADAPA